MFSLKQLNVNSVFDRSALEPSSERVNGASFSSVPIDATEEKDIPLDDDDDHVEPQYEEEKLQVCLITLKILDPQNNVYQCRTPTCNRNYNSPAAQPPRQYRPQK